MTQKEGAGRSRGRHWARVEARKGPPKQMHPADPFVRDAADHSLDLISRLLRRWRLRTLQPCPGCGILAEPVLRQAPNRGGDCSCGGHGSQGPGRNPLSRLIPRLLLRNRGDAADPGNPGCVCPFGNSSHEIVNPFLKNPRSQPSRQTIRVRLCYCIDIAEIC